MRRCQPPFRCGALPFLLALSPLTAPAQTTAPDTAPAEPVAQAEPGQIVLLSGTYAATWTDGRRLVASVRMLTQDMITLQRHAYSSVPVTFRRVAPGVFRDRDGNTLTVISPVGLLWQDVHGQVRVTYAREN